MKHAADEEQRLYTAEERVKMALAKSTAGDTFAPEQQWLDRIRVHLVKNLPIEQDDVDLVAVSFQPGCRQWADTVSDGELPEISRRMYEAIST